jgi:hypothetical protein
MNSKQIGDISEAKLTAALLAKGKVVLKPYGDNQRYDLAVEENGILSRIQCKTGKLINGAISFRTTSVYGNNGNRRGYVGQIEFFGVYCPQVDRCFLVPISDTGKSEVCLRVLPPKKNGYQSTIRWADSYSL